MELNLYLKEFKGLYHFKLKFNTESSHIRVAYKSLKLQIQRLQAKDILGID